jgi:hypothetical protein
MRAQLTLIFSAFLAVPSIASEITLKHDEIVSLLTDVVLYADQNGQVVDQIFQKSGATFYNAGGSQSQGTWQVVGDQYCSTWPPNPALACYVVVGDADKVTFIDKSGKRFEMRLHK